MFIERNRINGNVTVSDIIDNQYIKQVYIGYSIKECKRLFKEYVKTF